MSAWAYQLGSTAAERAATYPAHDVLPDAHTLYRAVDVDAPPAVVFRWLCQLRVAPYSYDLLDNLGRRSPRTLTPGLENLEVGQRFMTIFTLVAFEPDRSLTLLMTARRARRLFGDVAVTYDVTPRGEGSRLLAVLRISRRSRALVYGDAVMMRKQLRTLAALAARHGRDT